MVNINYLNNVLNILLFILNTILLGLYSFVRIRVSLSNNNIIKTKYYVINNFSYLIGIFSYIRSGKTSIANGIINILEEHIYNKCLKTISETIDNLSFIDFLVINDYLICELTDIDDINFYNNLDTYSQSIVDSLKLNGLYIFNYIEYKQLVKIIKRYIECFYVVNYRGVYVYSRTWRYSYFSKNNAIFLNNDTMNIKSIPNTKDFYLRKYSIIFEDETSLYNSNLKSFSKADKDTGRSELKRLFGQIFEETNYYVSVKQESSNEISNERSLYTDVLYQQDRKVYNDYKIVIKILNSIKSFRLLINKLFYYLTFKKRKYIEYELYYLSTSNKLRYKNRFINGLINFLYSLSIEVRTIRKYHIVEDVSKANLNNPDLYDEVKLTFNQRDLIGNYNNHEYSFVLDLLNKENDRTDINYTNAIKNLDEQKEMANFIYTNKSNNKVIESKGDYDEF